jgi:hypothetical protein
MPGSLAIKVSFWCGSQLVGPFLAAIWFKPFEKQTILSFFKIYHFFKRAVHFVPYSNGQLSDARF